MKFRNILLILLLSTLSCITAGYSQNTIEGYVLYHNQPSKPLPGTSLSLTSLQNGMVIATAVTNNLGKYVFTNIPDGSYQLTATSSSLPSGGVTIGDSYLILLHLLGFYQLSGIQQLAADVTGNGQVGWDDYTTIVIGWFLYGYPFPAGDWAFTSAIVTTGMKDSTNLGGTSQADVNGSYVPNLIIKEETTVAITENTPNSQSSADFCMSKPTPTSGFGLVFDLSPGTDVTMVTSELSGFEYTVTGEQLRLSWISQSGKEIAFDETTKLFTVEGNNLSLSPTTESHFINATGEIIRGVNLKKCNLTNGNSGLSITSIIRTSQNLNIEINTNQSQRISISIIDLSGRIIMSSQEILSPGNNTIHLNPALTTSGIYTVNLKSYSFPNLSLSRKLVICN